VGERLALQCHFAVFQFFKSRKPPAPKPLKFGCKKSLGEKSDAKSIRPKNDKRSRLEILSSKTPTEKPPKKQSESIV
jgi:hypothetical protein